MNPSHSPTKKIQIGPKKKVGFVCSGGGAKAGAFHLGVALALQERGFKFFSGSVPHSAPAPQPGPMEISTYVGSSAGSIICSFLAAGYSLENIFNSFLSRETDDPRDVVPKRLPRLTYQKMFKLRADLIREQLRAIVELKTVLQKLLRKDINSLIEFKWVKAKGLFSTRGIEEFIREDVLLSNRFEDYLPELFIVATQLNHSRKTVFGKYHYNPPPEDPGCQYINDISISQACAASTALPFIFAPYAISTKPGKITHYIDGEIRDTLSTHVALDAGADLVFASYTHQPYHFVKRIGSLTMMGLPSILVQSIYLLIEQKINYHVHNKHVQRNAINAVSKYCKQQGLDEIHRKRIVEILESELKHRLHTDTIYIHPRPTDHKMFTLEHFSLSPSTMTEIVRHGFKAGTDVLRHYEFADYKHHPQPPVTIPTQQVGSA